MVYVSSFVKMRIEIQL